MRPPRNEDQTQDDSHFVCWIFFLFFYIEFWERLVWNVGKKDDTNVSEINFRRYINIIYYWS